jgi:hypothetical protein
LVPIRSLSLIEPINAVADSAKWAKLKTLRLSEALAAGFFTV